jgi:uncharacterized protein
VLGTGWTEAAALAAALVIAVLATPAGISGAVLLLPFQVSVLGTPSPAVTPTNLLYNVVATPGALYRYWRQGHSVHHHGPVAPDWPTGIALGIGGLAGAYIGARIQRHLPDTMIRRVMGVLVVATGARSLWLGLG